MSIARSIRPLFAVTAVSVLALTGCGGSAEQTQGTDGESGPGGEGDSESENGSAGESGSASGEAYEVLSEHELIDMTTRSERPLEPGEVCACQAYDQLTADFIADFIDPAVESAGSTANGTGTVECGVHATDADGRADSIAFAGYYQEWSGTSGPANVNCEDGAPDEEFILEEWIDGGQYTETAELIEDESSDAVYLYDPEGFSQMGLLCTAGGSAIMVEIVADEEESSQSMIDKVRSRGQLEPVMQNFAARIDSLDAHFDAIDQAA